jgi:hypothetical protein
VTVVVIIFAVVAVAAGRSAAQLICHVTGEASQPAEQPPRSKGCGRHFEETRRCYQSHPSCLSPRVSLFGYFLIIIVFRMLLQSTASNNYLNLSKEE